MHKTGLGTLMAAIGMLGWCTGTAFAYDGAPVTGGDTITGMVKFQGAPPAHKALEVTKDKEVCAAHGELKAEDLLVGSGGGIENAVVSITNISKGKPMDAATPTLDQNGCKYVPHVLLFPAGSTVKIIN